MTNRDSMHLNNNVYNTFNNDDELVAMNLEDKVGENKAEEDAVQAGHACRHLRNHEEHNLKWHKLVSER